MKNKRLLSEPLEYFFIPDRGWMIPEQTGHTNVLKNVSETLKR